MQMENSDTSVPLRECSGCKIEKPISDFYRDSRGPGGYKKRCKDCGKVSRQKQFLVKKNEKSLSEIERKRKKCNDSIKRLLGSELQINTYSILNYKKFRNDVAKALSEIDYVLDTYDDKIINIGITTNVNMQKDDPLDFKIVNNMSFVMVKEIKFRFPDLLIMPYDIEIERVNPRKITLKYSKDGITFPYELVDRIKDAIQDIEITEVIQVD
jgi:hypothetical protein